MRICFVTSGGLEFHKEAQGADIVCFPFRALGAVNYERELKGETSLFEDVALYSKEYKNVVVCGCYSNARGILRKSAVVAERGRILGVADMVSRLDGGKYRSGECIRFFDTAAGRLGIAVGEDLYTPDVFETLSVCGAELILSIFETPKEGLETLLVRAYSYLYGVPVCLVSCGYAAAGDIGGKLAFATPLSPALFECEEEQEFHLVETRRRGFFIKKRTEL